MKLNVYVKQSMQMLRENPLISSISIAGTALAIAVILVLILVFQINAAGFAPESNRDRFLYVWGANVLGKEGGGNRGNMSSEVVRECFYSLKKPEAVAAYFRENQPVSLPGKRLYREYDCCYTDAGYWKVFDFRFVEGAPFTQADFQSAIPRVVLSERMAKRLFGGESAVGKQLVIDFVTYTVTGVVRDVPNPLMVAYFDICIPYTCSNYCMQQFAYGENMIGSFCVIMLARSSSDFDAVRKELNEQVARYNKSKVDYQVSFPTGVLSQLDAAMGSSGWRKVDWRTYLAGSGLVLLLLLLVPALNLMGVIHFSIQKRSEEIALRKAFGATKRDLMTQILWENFVQTLIGGVIGLGLSVALLTACKSFLLNSGITITFSMLMQPWWFLAALLFTFLLNLISAGLPTWFTLQRQVANALKGEE